LIKLVNKYSLMHKLLNWERIKKENQFDRLFEKNFIFIYHFAMDLFIVVK